MGQPLIYIVACISTGKIYVGKTVDFKKRRREHLWYAASGSKLLPKFYNAIRAHGESDFFWFTVACPDAALLDAWEILWIRDLDAVEGGYNCTFGGEGARGVVRSPEYRARKSIEAKGNKHNLGRPCSPETRAKIAAANRGRKHSAISRQHMSEAHRKIA